MFITTVYYNWYPVIFNWYTLEHLRNGSLIHYDKKGGFIVEKLCNFVEEKSL